MPIEQRMPEVDKKAILEQAYNSKFDLLLHYVYNGGSVDIADNAGRTPLIISVLRGDIESTEFLLRLGASSLVRDLAGFSAQDYAVVSGNKSILKVLRTSDQSKDSLRAGKISSHITTKKSRAAA